MTAAILGGTFNPVHIGHLVLAAEVREALGYDRIILVPAYLPVHKDATPVIDGSHRLAMLRLAVAGSEGLEVNDCELRRGGPSYAIDTVRELAPRLEGRPGLILGDDLAAGFGSWRDAGRLAASADLILVRRGDVSRGEFPWPHRAVENTLLAISSSDIRGRIAAGRSVRFLVPDAVIAWIREHRLYGCHG